MDLKLFSFTECITNSDPFESGCAVEKQIIILTTRAVPVWRQMNLFFRIILFTLQNITVKCEALVCVCVCVCACVCVCNMGNLTSTDYIRPLELSG